MTAATMTLTDFLLARIAEDEATDMRLPHRNACRMFGGWPGDPSSAADCDCGLSSRVLAECEAKRRIVEDVTNPHTSCPELDEVARILAAVYADHPDYRDEWRP